MINSLPFHVYRFYHADGSSKDWAICDNGNGTYTKRWGKTGTRLQSKDFTLNDPNNFWRETQAKESKGYIPIGKFYIDDNGVLTSATEKTAPMEPPKEPEQIYWRIHNTRPVQPLAKDIFRGEVMGYVECLLSVFPGNAWLQGMYDLYNNPKMEIPLAGSLQKQNSVASLLLLMTLKKVAVEPIKVSLAFEDDLEISDQLKLEKQALAFFDTDLESVRDIAVALKLIEKPIVLAAINTNIADLFF